MKGAVLGYPIQHSLSPTLHNALFKILGIEGEYSALEVSSGDLAAFFATHGAEFNYLSLTMPLKEEALELEVVKDELVLRTQSANTLYQSSEGWKLTSTDGSGFLSALKNAGVTKSKRTLVLGAGGTARAVVGALDNFAEEIVVLGRTSTRKESLQRSVVHSQFAYERWTDSINFEDFDLVVNTTPAGAADLLAGSLRPGSAKTLFDVIYKPWPTVLAARWADCGGEVINGLELLMYQGIHQLQYALGRSLNEMELAQEVRPILRAAAK